jgi:hypothetical protein
MIPLWKTASGERAGIFPDSEALAAGVLAIVGEDGGKAQAEMKITKTRKTDRLNRTGFIFAS